MQVFTYQDGQSVNYNEIEETYQRKEIKSLKTYDYLSYPNDYLSAIHYELVRIDPAIGKTKYGAINWIKVASIFQGSDGLGSFLETGLPSNAKVLLPSNVAFEDTMQFVKAIFENVRSTIKWNGEVRLFPYHSLEKIVKSGSGSNAEINVLTYLLLKEAGVKTYLVAASTADFGKVNPSYPSLQAFNQLLNMVVVGNEQYWFNTANQNAGFGYLEASNQGNIGLLLKDNTGYLIPIKQTRNRNTNLLTATLDITGNLNGTSMSVYEQALGAKMRALIEDSSIYCNKEVKPNYESVSINSYELGNFSNTNESLIEKVEFSISHAAKKSENKLVMKPLSILHKPQLKTAEALRDIPIDFGIASQQVNKIIINLPPGYKIVSLPKPIVQKTQDGVAEFKLLVTQQENQIQLLMELKINSPLIEALNLPFYNLFVNGINESLEQLMVIEKE